MVKVGSASLSDDTGVVHLEGKLVGLDGYRDWSKSDGSGELGWAVWSDISECLDEALSLGGNVFASSVHGSVWIVRLELKWVLLNVLEGVVHETTVASFVAERAGAVNELLLRVGLESLGLQEHSSLD